jgi:hypothetical protein
MAVGLPLKTTYANGDVYSASDVNDTNGTVNLIGQTNNFYAGKNRCLNGDYSIWQRGTSFTLATATLTMTADRYYIYSDFLGTSSVSRQTFTPGTAPVSGYESAYFLRFTAGTTSSYYEYGQKIEDVRTLANQSATFSFWAKASVATTLTSKLAQNFGSGGSSQVVTTLGTHSITTSWQRFTVSVTVPSVSGKTIGTSSYVTPILTTASITGSQTIDTWGWQFESGSAATAFAVATGSIATELVACQRYYIRYSAVSNYSIFANSAFAQNTTVGAGIFSFPVQMRITPSSIETSTLAFSKWDNTHYTLSSLTLDTATSTEKTAYVYGTGSGMTAGNIGYFGANNSTSAYIGFSAEL